MRKESQNEIAKQGLVMDERIKPKIGLRIGIFHVLEKGKSQGYGFLRRAIVGNCSLFAQSFARK